MSKVESFTHRFVEYVPRELEEGVLYVSMAFNTVTHSCACGCGREVVTPLGRTDWKLIFDGESISLYPSVGSWNLPCQSHYWIRNNGVVWGASWTKHEIEKARVSQQEEKHRLYTSDAASGADREQESYGLLRHLRKWWPEDADK